MILFIVKIIIIKFVYDIGINMVKELIEIIIIMIILIFLDILIMMMIFFISI